MGSLVQIQPGPPDTGGLAQLGERLLCKQDVVGSIPSSSTRHTVSFKFQVTCAPRGGKPVICDLQFAISVAQVKLFFKNLEEVIG